MFWFGVFCLFVCFSVGAFSGYHDIFASKVTLFITALPVHVWSGKLIYIFFSYKEILQSTGKKWSLNERSDQGLLADLL